MPEADEIGVTMGGYTFSLILAVKPSEIRGINELTRQPTRQGAVNCAVRGVILPGWGARPRLTSARGASLNSLVRQDPRFSQKRAFR